MRLLLFIVFLLSNYLCNAQLIDPFGKIIVHEIKLDKKKDGTYAGAIEWTTGGIDSLQRFIIQGLDINAPVMVRIISKAPDHNIDLSFHKKNWNEIASKISTDGEKFVDKVFRTMDAAGLGVRSKVAGIPYLITVKVGLQFPSTKSLIRITDDKEEYTRHLRKLGFNGDLSTGNNTSKDNNSEANNNSMYIIIGLLIIIVLLLLFFLIKRNPPKTISILVLCLGLPQLVVSQNSGPRIIPLADQPDVFIGYKTQNVENQTPIPITNPRVRDASVDAIDPTDGTTTSAHVRIASNPASRELSRQEIEELTEKMKEIDDQFDQDYIDNMPGEGTDGDQRILPVDRDNEELNRLRRQVQELQRRVDVLSQEDEEYEQDDDEGGEILIYCEQTQECQRCIMKGYRGFMKHHAYYRFLQNFYARKMTSLNGWIEYGDALASVPGAGLGWGPIRMHKVMPAMDELTDAYEQKFDQYMDSMEEDLAIIEACYGDDDSPSLDGYVNQVFAMIQALKASRITYH